MIQRTGISALPAAANSGQYLATGASGSSSPRSTRMCAASEVIALVVDHTLVSVSGCHGLVLARSAQPAQRFTTGSPATATATLGKVARECLPHRLVARRATAVDLGLDVLHAPPRLNTGRAPAGAFLPASYARPERICQPVIARPRLRLPAAALQPSFRAAQRDITKPGVQAAPRLGREQLPDPAHGRMIGGRLDQERTQAMIAVGRVDEHITQPRNGGLVSHEPRKPDLRSVRRVESDDQRVLDRRRHDLVGSALRPVCSPAHPAMHQRHVDQSWLVTRPVAIRPSPSHAVYPAPVLAAPAYPATAATAPPSAILPRPSRRRVT